MYSLNNITGSLVLSWVGRSSIGRFDAEEMDALKSTRGSLSIPGLAVKAYTAAASACGINLGSLEDADTASVNASLLWKIAADYATEALNTEGECVDCPVKHKEFSEYACNTAKTMLDRVSTCMSSQIGFACGTADDLPDIFNFTSETNCECP